MRTIIGYGNELRGEDSFGLDVIKRLEKKKLKDTQLLMLFQLTPEIVLDLLESDEVIFIDATYSENNHYVIACSREEQNSFGLTHHISPKMIIDMLNSLYSKYPRYQVFSILTNSFEKIHDKNKYHQSLNQVVNYLIKLNED